ncbi:LysR substrate-binding domain-containing protein [Collimonas sp. NPDC087041]|uniref:LysR substrate-binding domain-containing protein n=1 Tax=Collimonas sp. NPDC087041 TaxID=3363960 RepID=UPI003830F81D
MIRFRQIEAFRSLMISGTSVSAARRMHITQPAISRLIADLETDLGFRLFNRAKGRLEPTNAGVRFYKAVEENFLGLERLMQVAGTIRHEAPEGLTIACLPVLSTTLLPEILQRFFKQHPDVSVKIDSCSVPEILVGLQDLKVDMALSLAFPPFAGIEVEAIMKANVLCAMPATHPLAKKDVVTPADLDGENVIGWMPNSAQSYDQELSTLHAASIRPHYTIQTHTSHTRYAMVANGFGVAIVEPFAAKVWRPHGVVTRPFKADINYEYVLAYPSGGIRSELGHDLREAALYVAKNYGF